MSTPKAARRRATVTERDVSEYLRAHPDFFVHHEDLLTTLHIPHATGDAVSLIQYQAQRLRGEVEALQKRERDMHDRARENQGLHGKIHRFTLDLIGARSVAEIMERARLFLESEFQVEPAVALLAETVIGTATDSGFYRAIAPSGPEFNAFEACLKSGHALCGRLRHRQLRILFGDRAVEIRSAAFMPLGQQGELGMLAIGSAEKDRFDDHLGTVFLDNMADVIAHAIQAHA